MNRIVETIEISRRPEDVFAYATDFSRWHEWQGSVVSARDEGDGPLTLGSRAVVTRRVGPRNIPTTEEVTALDPPRRWTVRGTGGAAVAIATGTIEPAGDGSRSRVSMALSFEGHGIGKLMVPLVVRPQGRRQLPKNLQSLKSVLEASG